MVSWFETPAVDEFRGLQLHKLGVDEAYVNITSHVADLWLYTLSLECYKCPFSRELAVDGLRQPLVRSSRGRQRWRFLRDGDRASVPDEGSSYVCELDADLGEFGVYDVVIGEREDGPMCTLTTELEPVNIYLPLAACVLAILALCLLYTTMAQLHKCWRKHEQTVSDAVPVAKKRVKALDTFRGISIVLMIFVNYGAGAYSVLEHATWNGLQLADLVFPWFMWIMGVCVPLSVSSQLKRKVSRASILCGVLRRSCILFALGLTLNTLGRGSNLRTLRLFGVLQRFGVVYLVSAALCVCVTDWRRCMSKKKAMAAIHDVVLLLPQWAIMGAIVATHSALVFLFPVPGCPRGYLGPGGNHEGGAYHNCTGGVTGYVDRVVLGVAHMYKDQELHELYKSQTFDPEGLLGCLLSVFQTFLGVQAGTILVVHQQCRARLVRWLLWCALTGAIGAILCLASREDGWIPINKKLWSLSFVLVTSCFAFFLLTVCYLLVDVKSWWSGAPFRYPGMNATIMYVGHSVAYNLFPWHWAVGAMNTHWVLLLEALWGTALWVGVAAWLHHINFFLSL